MNTLGNVLREKKTGARDTQKVLTQNINLAIQRGNVSSMLRTTNKKLTKKINKKIINNY